MINSRIIRIILVLLYAIIFAGCANIVAPEGGPKDITSPVPLKSEPENKSTNFKGNSFRVYFNEFVKVKDASNQALVSPPVKQTPDFIVRGHSVIVKFNDTLKPATTYDVSFGNSVSDITEGNILQNFHYIFSTGPTLDSFYIEGKVVDALSLNPVKGIYVMFYNINSDSIPYKEAPAFISRTNEYGYFSCNNLPSGSFKIFALKDENSNFLYDLPTEQIGFSDTLIPSAVFQKKIIDDTTASKDSSALKSRTTPEISLKLFSEVDSIQKFIKCYPLNIGVVRLVFKFKPEDFQFQPLKPEWNKNSYIVEPNTTGDTLQIWISDILSDSLTALIKCKGITYDTINVRLITEKISKKTGKGTSSEPLKLTQTISASETKPIDINKPLQIVFSRPIVAYDTKKIYLTGNKDTLKPEISFIDSAGRRLNILYKWEEDKEYSFFAGPGTFTDIQGYYNDTLSAKFISAKAIDYGSLTLKTESRTGKGHVIMQLSDAGNKLIKEFSSASPQKYTINYLNPGNYKLKAYLDANNNGKWDTGNYLKKLQPEKISVYMQNIIIKAGWETEIEWSPEF